MSDNESMVFGRIVTPYDRHGLREGFRRLSIVIGVAVAMWYMFYGVDQISEYSLRIADRYMGGGAQLFIEVATTLMGFVAFFVGVLVTKSVGWAIDGFLK